MEWRIRVKWMDRDRDRDTLVEHMIRRMEGRGWLKGK